MKSPSLCVRGRSALACAFVALCAFASVRAAEPQTGARQAQGRPAADDPTVIIKSQHKRLQFAQDIQRIAVGDTTIVTADLITSREVLALGRETGRTTLIVWF